MSRSTYKSLRRREAAVQKQLKRATAPSPSARYSRVSSQVDRPAGRTGARLRREHCLQLLADINKLDSGPTTESS